MNGVEGRKEYNDELTLFNLSERRVQEGEEDKGKGNHIGYTLRADPSESSTSWVQIQIS